MNPDTFINIGRQLSKMHTTSFLETNKNEVFSFDLSDFTVEDIKKLLYVLNFQELSLPFLRNNIDGLELVRSYKSNDILKYFFENFELSISNCFQDQKKLLSFLSTIKNFSDNGVPYHPSYSLKLGQIGSLQNDLKDFPKVINIGTTSTVSSICAPENIDSLPYEKIDLPAISLESASSTSACMEEKESSLFLPSAGINESNAAKYEKNDLPAISLESASSTSVSMKEKESSLPSAGINKSNAAKELNPITVVIILILYVAIFQFYYCNLQYVDLKLRNNTCINGDCTRNSIVKINDLLIDSILTKEKLESLIIKTNNEKNNNYFEFSENDLYSKLLKLKNIDKIDKHEFIFDYWSSINISNSNVTATISNTNNTTKYLIKAKRNFGILNDLKDSIIHDNIEEVKTIMEVTDIDNEVIISPFNGWLSIHVAARYNSINVLKCLLDNNANISAIDSDGDTPLAISIYYGNVKVTTYLLNNHANINTKDYYNQTLLHAAVAGNEIEVMKELINRGIDINAVDNAGYSPLFHAVKLGNIEIIQYLLDNNEMDINIIQGKSIHDRTSLLHLAIMYNHIEVVKLLILKGADVLLLYDNLTSLHLAIQYKYQSICELILNLTNHPTYSYINPIGISPIHTAILYDQIDILKLLHSKGFDINNLSKYQISPIKQAIMNGNLNICTFLVKEHVLIEQDDLDLAVKNGFTDIVYLFKSKRKLRKLKVEHLLLTAVIHNHFLTAHSLIYNFPRIPWQRTYDSSVDTDYNMGDNLFHIAVDNENEDMINLLYFKFPNDILKVNMFGYQPIHNAILNKYTDLAIFLQSLMAIDDIVIHPVAFAIRYGNYVTVKRLVEYGTLVYNNYLDYNNDENQTLLHIAVKQNNIDIIKLLLEYGINRNSRDIYDKTVLYYTNNNDLIDYLFSIGIRY